MADIESETRDGEERAPLGAWGVMLGLVAIVLLATTIHREVLPAIQARSTQLVEVPARLKYADGMRETGKRRPDYWVETQYEYWIDGKTYHGERLGFGHARWRTRDIDKARAVRDQLRNREPFFVYVDARNPNRAVAFSDPTGILTPGVIGVGLFACALLGVSVVLVLAEVSRRRREDPSRPWSPDRIDSAYRDGSRGFDA